MLGLIYKDLVQNKFLTGIVIFCIAVYSFCSATVAGFGVIFTLMTFVFASMLCETSFGADSIYKWNIYAACLPTVRKTTLARYVLMLSVYGVCLAFSLLGAVLSKKGGGLDVYSLIVLFSFVLALDSVSQAFYFRFGIKKGGAFKLFVIIMIPAAFIMYLLFGDLSVFGSDGFLDLFDWITELGFVGIMRKIWPYALVFAAVCFAGGCAVSRKVYTIGVEKAE